MGKHSTVDGSAATEKEKHSTVDGSAAMEKEKHSTVDGSAAMEKEKHSTVDGSAAMAVPEYIIVGDIVGEHLPDEIVRDIISRLRAKEILRFQGACRNWMKATTSSEFVNAFHVLKPALPLVVFRAQDEGGSPCYGTCGPSYTGKLEVLDVVKPYLCRVVVNFDNRLQGVLFSCDGLLLVSPGCKQHYVLINPATRQALRLGNLSTTTVDALYPAEDGLEYRVLFHFGGRQSLHMVLTIGTGEAPRRVDLPAGRRELYPPVLFKGSLHWLSSSKRSIILFDTMTESCTEMSSPTSEFWARIFQINHKTLGVSLYIEERDLIHVWIAQNNTEGRWELKFTIDLNQMNQKLSDPSMYQVLSDKGDVLLFLPGRAVQMSSDGNAIKEAQFTGLDPVPVGFMFKESIRRYPFFDEKTDDGKAELVFDYSEFFKGL